MDKQAVKEALVEQLSLAKNSLYARPDVSTVSCLLHEDTFKYVSMVEFIEVAESVFPRDIYDMIRPNTDPYYVSVVRFSKRNHDKTATL